MPPFANIPNSALQPPEAAFHANRTKTATRQVQASEIADDWSATFVFGDSKIMWILRQTGCKVATVLNAI
jgi:hypothetical protein